LDMGGYPAFQYLRLFDIGEAKKYAVD
jgi:hypothetical protein